jgi:hypothetical protein
MSSLDITKFKEHGKELMVAIDEAMSHYTGRLYLKIPSKLKMTALQYADLMSHSGLAKMYDPNDREDRDRMFVTNKGYVLEVKVVE